mmetsp:Transcript_14032/g.39718  ORF Transcript_14032/g.39718 Transcript_14032/m.39718 type:complete len:157 (-) Transcript_14032:282-752(-)
MPRYFVLQKGQSYEVRLYDPHTAVTMECIGLQESLDKLKRYLGGENSEQQALQARKPVVISVAESGTKTVAMCIVPVHGQEAPAPVDPELSVEKELGKVLAVACIDKDALNEDMIDDAKQKLLHALNEGDVNGHGWHVCHRRADSSSNSALQLESR